MAEDELRPPAWLLSLALFVFLSCAAMAVAGTQPGKALPQDARVIAATAPELLLLADVGGRPTSIAHLLSGEFVPRPEEPCYVLLGPWDIAAPYGPHVLTELASDRWDLIDSRSECWMFRRRW